MSIVATALDGHKTENKTVLNMFSRVQSKNTGFSENLFSQNTRFENNTLSSIDGATALKLDESFQLDEDQEQTNSMSNDVDNDFNSTSLIEAPSSADQVSTNFPSGVSIESASYMENHNLVNNHNDLSLNENTNEEPMQKLFSEEQSDFTGETTTENNHQENSESDQLFDQDIYSEEEDFEIPAFLRKQKF